MTIKCLAATQVGGELQEFSYEPPELSPLDIEIAISHCGVCHTDIHMIDQTTGWGVGHQPRSGARILYTEDRGYTWEDRSPPDPALKPLNWSPRIFDLKSTPYTLSF